MKKIRFAVVGCGNIGIRHIAVINAESQAELVSVCDIDVKKLKIIEEKYDVECYTSFTKMLQRRDVDVVCICTPHLLHAPMAIEAAKNKINVLTEKPMALTTMECKKMITVAKKNKVTLFVVKQNRYNIPVKMLKKALDKKWLGRIFIVTCNVLWNRTSDYYTKSNWRGTKKNEGGVLYTQVSHFVDLLLWFFGDVEKVISTVVDTKKQNIEIEDCGQATLNFKNGAMGSLMWTTCVYNKNYEGSIFIIGEYGTVKIGGQYLNEIEYWEVKNHPLPQDVKFVDKPNIYKNYQGTSSNHDKVIQDVIAYLHGKKNSVVLGEEGVKTTTLIEKIYKNAI